PEHRADPGGRDQLAGEQLRQQARTARAHGRAHRRPRVAVPAQQQPLVQVDAAEETRDGAEHGHQHEAEEGTDAGVGDHVGVGAVHPQPPRGQRPAHHLGQEQQDGRAHEHPPRDRPGVLQRPPGDPGPHEPRSGHPGHQHSAQTEQDHQPGQQEVPCSHQSRVQEGGGGRSPAEPARERPTPAPCRTRVPPFTRPGSPGARRAGIFLMPRFHPARAVENRGHESAGGKAHRPRGRLVAAVVRRLHRRHGARARARFAGRPLRLGGRHGARGGAAGGRAPRRPRPGPAPGTGRAPGRPAPRHGPAPRPPGTPPRGPPRPAGPSPPAAAPAPPPPPATAPPAAPPPGRAPAPAPAAPPPPATAPPAASPPGRAPAPEPAAPAPDPGPPPAASEDVPDYAPAATPAPPPPPARPPVGTPPPPSAPAPPALPPAPPDAPATPATAPPPVRGYVGTRPPTYDAEPTALPPAEPDALDDLVPDTVLDGARYGASTLRAASVRGDSARYRGEPRRDALLTARFGSGERALVLVAVATGARATPRAHRAADEVCRWIGRAVGRSHARLVDDIRAARRGDLKSGLNRLTDRSLGRLRAHAVEQGLEPDAYAASLRCLLLTADPECRTRVFFGVGPGGLFRLRDGEWQDIEPRVADVRGAPVLGFGSPPPETPRGDRLTMDLGLPAPPSAYEPSPTLTDLPEPPREPFR